RAHVLMLRRRGIIDPAAQKAIARAFDRIEQDWERGHFQLDPALEDVHINLERTVAKIAGEQHAARIHTARSRNDQAATAIRMWLRDRVLDRAAALADL